MGDRHEGPSGPHGGTRVVVRALLPQPPVQAHGPPARSAPHPLGVTLLALLLSPGLLALLLGGGDDSGRLELFLQGAGAGTLRAAGAGDSFPPRGLNCPHAGDTPGAQAQALCKQCLLGQHRERPGWPGTGQGHHVRPRAAGLTDGRLLPGSGTPALCRGLARQPLFRQPLAGWDPEHRTELAQVWLVRVRCPHHSSTPGDGQKGWRGQHPERDSWMLQRGSSAGLRSRGHVCSCGP